MTDNDAGALSEASGDAARTAHEAASGDAQSDTGVHDPQTDTGAPDAPTDAWVTDASTDAVAPDASATFGCRGVSASLSTDVAPILARCGGEMCHGALAGGAWGGPVRLWQTFVNQPSTRDNCPARTLLVTPGDPSNSYLVKKLTGVGNCGGGRMPLRGAPLPNSEVQTIADWICAGAKNN